MQIIGIYNSTPIKDYSPIELIEYHIMNNNLDRRHGTYFVFNASIKIGHKVIITDTHIEAKEFVI